MKNVIKRLKSPIVIIQIISIFETFLIGMTPALEDKIKLTCFTLISLINVLAGLNNPTDKGNF